MKSEKSKQFSGRNLLLVFLILLIVVFVAFMLHLKDNLKLGGNQSSGQKAVTNQPDKTSAVLVFNATGDILADPAGMYGADIKNLEINLKKEGPQIIITTAEQIFTPPILQLIRAPALSADDLDLAIPAIPQSCTGNQKFYQSLARQITEQVLSQVDGRYNLQLVKGEEPFQWVYRLNARYRGKAEEWIFRLEVLK